MPMHDDGIREIMAEATAELHASHDLAERVRRSSGRKRTNRTRFAALATAVAVAGAVVPIYMAMSPGAAPEAGVAAAPQAALGGVAASASASPEAVETEAPSTATVETPAPGTPVETGTADLPTPDDKIPDLGDLGDGRAFG